MDIGIWGFQEFSLLGISNFWDLRPFELRDLGI